MIIKQMHFYLHYCNSRDTQPEHMKVLKIKFLKIYSIIMHAILSFYLVLF